MFRKSGEESWQAWVPVLNLVVLLRLGGLSGWLLLLALVPFVGPVAVWVVVVIACHRIGGAFGFGPGMTVLAALLLPVWASVIGFGTSRWVGAEASAGTRRTAPEVDPDGLAFLGLAVHEPRTPVAGPPPATRAAVRASEPVAATAAAPELAGRGVGATTPATASRRRSAGRGIRSSADPFDAVDTRRLPSTRGRGCTAWMSSPAM